RRMNSIFPAHDAPMKEQPPKERHLRILQALAQSSEPLSTIALSHQIGRTGVEIASACAWLRNHYYIARELKPIRRPAFGGSVAKKMAFWFLTEKGREYLSVKGKQ